MYRVYISALQAFTLLICTVPLNAQQVNKPIIRGKVMMVNPYNPYEVGGGVRITVINKTVSNEIVPGEQGETAEQTWFHEAPLGARVDIQFARDGYEFNEVLHDIQVNTDNPELPLVKLQLTRSRKILLRQQRRIAKSRVPPAATASAGTRESRRTVRPASASHGSRAESIGESGVMAAVGNSTSDITLNEAATESQVSADESSKAKPKVEADNPELIPKPDDLKHELEREATIARRGAFFDIFQNNFAENMRAYGDIRELLDVLVKFKQENTDLFQPLGSVKPEMFNDVVNARFETTGDVNVENVKTVIKEKALSAGIRGGAVVAQLNVAPDDSEMKAYYHQQWAQGSSAPLYATAAVALFRIGEGKEILSYIAEGDDTSKILVNLHALRVAQIIEGPEAVVPDAEKVLADVATHDDDPNLRNGAVLALRPFAFRGNETAINALLYSAGDRSENPEVRVTAINALGVGHLEYSTRVRSLLWTVRRDSSLLVRNAANTLLNAK
ncbi:MAG: HEAT repeat domain-containing protein [Pyrinomonadaceae bacterium]